MLEDSLTVGAHGLLGEGADGVNGLWGTVLETDAVDALKENMRVNLSQFPKKDSR